MIDEEFIEIVNKAIDRTATDAELARLREYIAGNPEAKEYYEKLGRMSAILDKVKPVDPPPDLKRNVMSSIHARKHQAKQEGGLFYAFMKSLKVKVGLRYAFSFSAGIIVGVFALAVFFGGLDDISSLDKSDLSGTMIINGAQEGFETADRQQFSLGERVHGAVEVKFADAMILAEINIVSQDETEITIAFDESDVGYSGFRQLNHVPADFSIDRNNVKLTQKGDNRYVIVFRDKTQSVSAMAFKIQTAGLSDEITVYTGRRGE